MYRSNEPQASNGRQANCGYCNYPLSCPDPNCPATNTPEHFHVCENCGKTPQIPALFIRVKAIEDTLNELVRKLTP